MHYSHLSSPSYWKVAETFSANVDYYLLPDNIGCGEVPTMRQPHDSSLKNRTRKHTYLLWLNPVNHCTTRPTIQLYTSDCIIHMVVVEYTTLHHITRSTNVRFGYFHSWLQVQLTIIISYMFLVEQRFCDVECLTQFGWAVTQVIGLDNFAINNRSYISNKLWRIMLASGGR